MAFMPVNAVVASDGVKLVQLIEGEIDVLLGDRLVAADDLQLQMRRLTNN
jgi:hypothetical protein